MKEPMPTRFSQNVGTVAPGGPCKGKSLKVVFSDPIKFFKEFFPQPRCQ